MFNNLSLFASISLGCSVGYGLGGYSRQISSMLSEQKEIFSDNIRTFIFTDNDKVIQIDHIEEKDGNDKAVVHCDGKEYVFVLVEENGQLTATCDAIPGMQFVYSACGAGRMLCSQLSASGRCFVSVDTVTHKPNGKSFLFESFGMEVSYDHENWKGVSNFMKKQIVISLLLHEVTKYSFLDGIKDFTCGDLSLFADRFNAAAVFHNENMEHVVCMRGCTNHTVEVTCGGTFKTNIRYTVLLPNRSEKDIFSVYRYVNDKEDEESMSFIFEDNVVTIHYKGECVAFTFSVEKDKIVYKRYE